jgi:hypothetical protein
MTILPLKTETFDGILLNCQKYAKDFIIQRLEYYDRDIYRWVMDDPKRRFKLIRIDERTILTSLGIIKFKRRYYFDDLTGKNVYLLDNQLKIPSHVRMSNELIIKILDLASLMTYKEVGKHLSNEFELSKFTIWKTIRDTSIEAIYDSNINRGSLKVHVQIDEKYIGMVETTNKKRYYTATIFAGREKINKSDYKLLNKTILSASTLQKLKKRINFHLKNRYQVRFDEEIFVSGDMALYIQNFKDYVFCRAKYVPDKFHVFKAIKDNLPDLEVDDYSINDKNFQSYLIKNLDQENPNSRKIIKLLVESPKVFETYLDEEYLGCSQEGQNSHVYAPRFGKYANRFSKATIEKLALIREATVMDIIIKIGIMNREEPEIIDIGYCTIDLEEPLKMYLDTREMKYETRKLFENIRYGR